VDNLRAWCDADGWLTRQLERLGCACSAWHLWHACGEVVTPMTVAQFYLAHRGADGRAILQPSCDDTGEPLSWLTQPDARRPVYCLCHRFDDDIWLVPGAQALDDREHVYVNRAPASAGQVMAEKAASRHRGRRRRWIKHL